MRNSLTVRGGVEAYCIVADGKMPNIRRVVDCRNQSDATVRGITASQYGGLPSGVEWQRFDINAYMRSTGHCGLARQVFEGCLTELDEILASAAAGQSCLFHCTSAC